MVDCVLKPSVEQHVPEQERLDELSHILDVRIVIDVLVDDECFLLITASRDIDFAGVQPA